MGRLKIISTSDEPFANREEAARQLGQALGYLKEQSPVVLGIPRGGVIIARGIAQALSAPLDVILSRKLRSPFNPELAFGALTETGDAYLNQNIIAQLAIGRDYIEREKSAQLAEIRRRRELIRAVKPRVEIKGRRVIVTDDGIATGATMMSALWAVKHEGASYIACAVPVASESSLREMSPFADETVCLKAPSYFMAIGQFYLDFPQLTDDKLIEILRTDESQ